MKLMTFQVSLDTHKYIQNIEWYFKSIDIKFFTSKSL